MYIGATGVSNLLERGFHRQSHPSVYAVPGRDLSMLVDYSILAYATRVYVAVSSPMVAVVQGIVISARGLESIYESSIYREPTCNRYQESGLGYENHSRCGLGPRRLRCLKDHDRCLNNLFILFAMSSCGYCDMLVSLRNTGHQCAATTFDGIPINTN